MTHDELVDIAIVKDLNKLILKQMKAIDAVMELHKPLYYRKGEIETKGAHCDECSKGSHGENAVEYPCPTIQAIEKELG